MCRMGVGHIPDSGDEVFGPTGIRKINSRRVVFVPNGVRREWAVLPGDRGDRPMSSARDDHSPAVSPPGRLPLGPPRPECQQERIPDGRTLRGSFCAECLLSPALRGLSRGRKLRILPAATAAPREIQFAFKVCY